VGTTESRPDVVIVGGGFAEVTAARELTMRGRSAVLEARDRLGGRTYTADHDGHAMELGGTWVHPEQPHVGAEISRNGMETETFPVLWAVARTCGGDADDAFLGQRSFA
jgi:pseudooxynicotine oxidase